MGVFSIPFQQNDAKLAAPRPLNLLRHPVAKVFEILLGIIHHRQNIAGAGLHLFQPSTFPVFQPEHTPMLLLQFLSQFKQQAAFAHTAGTGHRPPEGSFAPVAESFQPGHFLLTATEINKIRIVHQRALFIFRIDFAIIQQLRIFLRRNLLQNPLQNDPHRIVLPIRIENCIDANLAHFHNAAINVLLLAGEDCKMLQRRIPGRRSL